MATVDRRGAGGLLPRARFTPDGVRQITMPPAARALSTLSRVDYEDAFVVETGPARGRTAEGWARAVLEDAPTLLRGILPWAWFALGLQQGSTRSDRAVLGWQVQRSTPNIALLGASSRIGLPAELLFMRDQHTLLFARFVQQENPIARAMWAGVAPVHRQVVSYLLEQARAKQQRPRGPWADRDAQTNVSPSSSG